MTDARPVHLVFSIAGADACLLRRGADEPVVLLGDGVYRAAALGRGTPLPPECFVLEADCSLRGVAVTKIAPAVQPIGYDALVALVATASTAVSWR